MRRLLLAVTAGALLAGCGDAAPDLFLVVRSGAIPGASFSTVLRDDGTVTCGGVRHTLPDPLLLRARTLQVDLSGPATKGVALPSGPRPVLTYFVQTPSGKLSFSDDSPNQPASFHQLALLTREIARGVCGFAR